MVRTYELLFREWENSVGGFFFTPLALLLVLLVLPLLLALCIYDIFDANFISSTNGIPSTYLHIQATISKTTMTTSIFSFFITNTYMKPKEKRHFGILKTRLEILDKNCAITYTIHIYTHKRCFMLLCTSIICMH